MKETLMISLSKWLKKTIPFLLTLFLLLFNYISIHLPMSFILRPNLVLCCLYFWVLYRPDLFGLPLIIVLGFIADTLSGEPLGINVCTLTFSYILTSFISQYINTKPFWSSWICFWFVCFSVFLFKWLVFSLYYKTFLSVPYIFISYFTTILVYPVVARLNIYIEENYMADDGEFYEQE